MSRFRIALLALAACSVAACSSQSLKQLGYDTLQSKQRQECIKDPRSECPETKSYDTYQQEVERLEDSGK